MFDKKIFFTLFMIFSIAPLPSTLQAKTYWKRGAVIGSSVAAAASLPFTYSLCNLAESDRNINSCRGTAMPLGALTSGIIGFGIGAGIGALFKQKEIVPYVQIDPQGENYHLGARMEF